MVDQPAPGRASDSDHRDIFQRLHAHHAACIRDEWLNQPCRSAAGALLDRPIVWSRRNGPWSQVDVLWIGAAPGNAGRKGSGSLGAHGTRIPFGGDVAGANLEVMLGAIGVDRNRTFILAALNQLPARGGGEPTLAEIFAPSGTYSSSLEVARDSLLAAGPRLVICLGNVAARVAIAAATPSRPRALPSTAALGRMGWRRGEILPLSRVSNLSPAFRESWEVRWPHAFPDLLWLTHPSAQNMSPFAGSKTAFHTRMLDALEALRRAARGTLGIDPPRRRAPAPDSGIYTLPEWRELIAPRNARLDRLWREKGV